MYYRQPVVEIEGPVSSNGVPNHREVEGEAMPRHEFGVIDEVVMAAVDEKSVFP